MLLHLLHLFFAPDAWQVAQRSGMLVDGGEIGI